MHSLEVAWIELKKLWRNKFLRVAAIAVCLMPLLYSFLYLWAFWDPYAHLSDLKIAVVNLDQPTERDGTKIQAGQEIVAQLKDDDSVGWKFTDYNDAHSGVESGKYDLAIVIPQDFSQAVADTTAATSGAAKAKLLYYSNPSNNFLADQIGGKISLELSETANSSISGQFFENVFSQISSMGSDLSAAASGSSAINDGIKSALNGGEEISNHLGDAAGGADSLYQGLYSLKQGAGTLTLGYASLADNTQMLGGAVDQAKSGLHSAVSGANDLHAGAESLAQGIKTAGANIRTAAQGTQTIDAGAQQAYSGLSSLTAVLHQLSGGAGSLLSGAGDLQDGLSQLKAGLSADTGLPAITSGVQGLSQGISGVQTQVAAANGSLTKAQGDIAALLADPSLTDSQKAALQDSLQNLGLTQKILGSDELSPGVYGVSANINSLGAGVTQLGQGIDSLDSTVSGSLDALIGGADQLQGGLSTLNDGLSQSAGGADQLNDGLKGLTDGTGKLSAALNSGADSFNALIDGGAALAQGSGQLANGLNGFTPMIGKLGDLSSGVKQLLDGARKLSTGANDAGTGSAQIMQGVSALHDGSNQLVDGLKTLSGGSDELAAGLKSGADKVAAQTPTDITAVGQAMGNPVEVKTNQVYPVKNYGTGFTPYFVPLALWVGALIVFFLVNPKENRLITAGVSPFSIVLGKYWTVGILGAIQSIISSFVLITVLKLHPDHVLGFYLFNIFLSLCFMAIIQFLVAALGAKGRFLAIVLLMLQLTSCQGTFPMRLIPKFFQVLSPFMPMTYGTAALRHIISGSANIGLGQSLLILLLFGAGSLAINILITSKWVKVRDIHPHAELAA